MYILAKHGKPFTDDQVVKDCGRELRMNLPQKNQDCRNLTLGANTVARHIGDMGENIMDQISSNAKRFLHFSIAMDESLYVCETSQLLIFIRGLTLRQFWH